MVLVSIVSFSNLPRFHKLHRYLLKPHHESSCCVKIRAMIHSLIQNASIFVKNMILKLSVLSMILIHSLLAVLR
jgi:hypothetical protein